MMKEKCGSENMASHYSVIHCSYENYSIRKDDEFVLIHELKVHLYVNGEKLTITYSLIKEDKSWGFTDAIDRDNQARPGILSFSEIEDLLLYEPNIKRMKEEIEMRLYNRTLPLTKIYEPQNYSPYDFVDFQNKCKHIAQSYKLPYTVLTFEQLGYTSFNTVKLHFSKGPLYLLCNHYRVAFVKDLGNYPFVFFDDSELAECFGLPYEVLSVQFLNQPLNIEDVVTGVEEFDVEYYVSHFLPKTNGEFLFNFWD